MDKHNREFVSLLERSGWRHNRVAMELHVDPGTVSRYVSGEVRPSMTVLKLFGRLLGEPLRYVEDSPRSFSETPPALEEHEARVFAKVRTLPPRIRRQFLEALDQLLSTAQQGIIDRGVAAEAALPPELLAEVDAATEADIQAIQRRVRRPKRAK